MSYLGLDENKYERYQLKDFSEKIFKDTVFQCTHDIDLINSIEESKKTSKVYDENYKHNNEVKIKSNKVNISVSNNRSFKAARKFVKEGNKVAVLNFANANNPGGGVWGGALTQEESLCRESTLHSVLDTKDSNVNFYGFHQQKHHAIFSDKIIYTKDITVFKTDETLADRLERENWYHVDVITQAAPQNGYLNMSDDQMYEVFYKRIKNIFEVAIENNVDVLILGAYGCGAFKNNPEIVAKAFKANIEDYYQFFKEVHFAILDGFNNNKEIFEKVLL